MPFQKTRRLDSKQKSQSSAIEWAAVYLGVENRGFRGKLAQLALFLS